MSLLLRNALRWHLPGALIRKCSSNPRRSGRRGSFEMPKMDLINFNRLYCFNQTPFNMPTKSIVLRFARLSDRALPPSRGSALAAGYDLYSAYEYTIPAQGKCLCKTDIQVAIPEGCYGRVAPRSGLASKHSIDVGAGVIDADYRGNVGVLLFNFGKDDFQVNSGDRIAQLICEKIMLPDLQEMKTLDATERGDAGFGSTGK